MSSFREFLERCEEKDKKIIKIRNIILSSFPYKQNGKIVTKNRINLGGAVLDYDNVLFSKEKCILLRLNTPECEDDAVFHIGIFQITDTNELVTLLFKNNKLAISDRLFYHYDESLGFKNITEFTTYVKYITSRDANLILMYSVSSAM